MQESKKLTVAFSGPAVSKEDDIFPGDPKTAVEALDGVFAYAVHLTASDIHIDPKPENIEVRVRVDGVLEKAGFLPKSLHDEIIARLKIFSGVRTDIHLLPQDGRWRSYVSGNDYNFRISFMPTYYGENAVIRLLPAKPVKVVSFGELGFTRDHEQMIDRALKKPNGLILVTGPTGSGKTTTIHTFLSLKAKEPLSIITLEDPIEYEIEGVRQIHIRHTHGVTFASGLRSALRQDPDVIMVGEIRDSETAKVAIHTALTGHLVMSTLHTNSALEAIPRLVDMGVDHFLLASTLRLIIAQRLIRRMCHECFAMGCQSCRDTGYLGRSLIAEVCEVDPGLSAIIENKGSLTTCMEHAGKRGFRVLADDGLEKVEQGITTREEIMKVLYT